MLLAEVEWNFALTDCGKADASGQSSMSLTSRLSDDRQIYGGTESAIGVEET